MISRNQAAKAQGNRRALRDVSNRVTENGSKKDGQPNVTKKNGSAAATGGVQRSVTMETREEVEVSAGDSSSGTANSAADAEALAGPVAASSSVPNPPSALTAESLAAYMSAGGTAASAVGSTAYQYSGPADDIDERDSDDPLCATSYVQEMYEHFRIKEVSTSVRPVYMEDQSFINERMRSILVDWLVEVHLKFKLVPETLYLTINVIDRYLSKTEVSRPKLQLVGVTALLIASKYEEIYPPELRDLVYICDRAYSKMEILDMEEIILKKLEYQITIPSAHAFLVRYLKAAHADKKIVQLSCFILDGTLQSYNMLHYLPSQLAAAAVFVARRTVGRNAWSPTLLKYAQYREEDVIPVARAVLAEKGSSSIELRAVNKKYTSSRYGGVANIAISSNF
mmetsp:Transcript_17800/g.40845  ORF Transcript_17800/g.40845 Transcript_17800/m.40845 type:complete len:397 (+) Transcript_17800:255-1445(+)